MKQDGTRPRVLLVIGHGREDSLCHHLLRTARDALEDAGAEVRVEDLLADGFDPVLRLPPGAIHALPEHGGAVARRYMDDVRWMDAIVIVHPVWWFGPPAILKGWVDAVLVDGVAIRQMAEGNPAPLLRGRRALLVQTFNVSPAIDRLIMRSMAETFWRRAVFLPTGLRSAGRMALHGAAEASPRTIGRLERRVRRAAAGLAGAARRTATLRADR